MQNQECKLAQDGVPNRDDMTVEDVAIDADAAEVQEVTRTEGLASLSSTPLGEAERQMPMR